MSNIKAGSIVPEAKLWTVPQTAKVMNLSTRSVYRLIALRQLAIKKIGRSTRVVVASVEQFIQGGSQ